MLIFLYFRGVKRKNSWLRMLACCLLGVVAVSLNAAPADSVRHAAADSVQGTTRDTTLAAMDSVEFCLLTCQPHDEIYSLYGHTALRYHDLRSKQDWAFNYGVFNFKAPYFVLRFVFGLTDYELQAVPMSYFVEEYRRFGSEVKEQVLNLTPEEKAALYYALAENVQPQNKIYRYNYFYDNCTTRARNIVERCIKGALQYPPSERDGEVTYREMVHACTAQHPWATFGNDLLLGVKSDLPTDMRQQEFLPANLMQDFAQAYILNPDGSRRPLVKETRTVVPAGQQTIKSGFPLSPTWCAVILLVVSLVIIVIEFKRKTIFVWWDALLMAAQGIVGIILVVMIFSQHPTTSLNLQLLLFNPIPLLYIYKVWKKRKTHYWSILVAMAGLFYLGAVWQDYAKGMEIVALCLLLRFWPHYKFDI